MKTLVVGIILFSLAFGLGTCFGQPEPLLAPLWSVEDLLLMIPPEWVGDDPAPVFIKFHYIDEDEPIYVVIAHSDDPDTTYLCEYRFDRDDGVWRVVDIQDLSIGGENRFVPVIMDPPAPNLGDDT